MALIVKTCTKKNNQAYAKTLLFNTDRIVDFYSKDASNTIVYYQNQVDRRDSTSKYEFALTKAQVESWFDESLYNTRIDLPVLEKFAPSKETFVKVVNVAASDVVIGIDIDASTSYVEVARGSFEIVKFKVNSTIAEIESASSTSVSIAI